MLKNPSKYERDSSLDKMHRFLRQFSNFATMTHLVEVPENTGGRIRSFRLIISFHHRSPCSYIVWGMNNRSVGGLIDMIITSIKFILHISNLFALIQFVLRKLRAKEGRIR
jgi:hypothetical protein